MVTSRLPCKGSKQRCWYFLARQTCTSRRCTPDIEGYLLMNNFFRPEDSEIEVASMKEGVGKMIPFPSVWGHWAGGPGDSKDDVKWLDGKLKEVGL